MKKRITVVFRKKKAIIYYELSASAVKSVRFQYLDDRGIIGRINRYFFSWDITNIFRMYQNDPKSSQVKQLRGAMSVPDIAPS